jgi:hypothetical protein
MARTFTPIVNTNSFELWVQRTNELVAAFGETITLIANTSGDVTSGNGSISGILAATVFAADSFRGGSVAVPNVAHFVSNVSFDSELVSSTANVSVVAANVSFSTNSSIEVLRIVGNSTTTSTTVGGNTLTVSANVTFNGTSFRVPSGNTTTRPSSPTGGTLRYNTENGYLEVYTNQWELVTSSANLVVDAVDVYFASSANISSNTVQGAIVETWNEKVSKTGDTMTGGLVLDLSGGLAQTSPTGTILQASQADGTASIEVLDAVANAAMFVGRRANGIGASRTTLANNDLIVTVSAYGFDGNSYQTSSRGSFDVVASQAWTNTGHATALVGKATQVGSATPVEVFRVTANVFTVNVGSLAATNLAITHAVLSGTLNVAANSTMAQVNATNVYVSANVSAAVVLAGGVNVRRASNTTVDGVTRYATAAEFRTGTDTATALQTKQVWDAAAEVTLTYSTSTVVTSGDAGLDMSDFINATITLNQNSTLGQPLNVKVGQSGCIRFVQDGTGSRTLSYHADWEFANGTAPTLTTTAGATDLLFYHVLASGRVFASLVTAVA